jgi:hypothetical protein
MEYTCTRCKQLKALVPDSLCSRCYSKLYPASDWIWRLDIEPRWKHWLRKRLVLTAPPKPGEWRLLS